MKKLSWFVACLALTCVMACGSPASTPTLVGNWIYVDPAGSTGIAVDINDDGTYVIADMTLTSSNSADAQVETGSYTATSSQINALPQKWSCRGADPGITVDYTFQDGNLLLSLQSGLVALQPNTATATTAFKITYGCFSSGVGFTPEQLLPIGQ